MLRISLLFVASVAATLLLLFLQLPFAAAQADTNQKQYDAASKTLVFQLRAWQPPQVVYDTFYSKAGMALYGTPFCSVIGPVHTGGQVVSFEGMRRAIAATAGIPLDWTYIFPRDDYVARFSLPSKEGWRSSGFNGSTSLTGGGATTAANLTATTTAAPATTLANATTAAAPPTAAPTTITAAPTTTVATTAPATQARGFLRYATAQIYAVWVVVQAVNDTIKITDAELLESNKKLLAISSNAGGDSTALATAAGPHFFGFNAMDFGARVSTEPMRAQLMTLHDYMLGVYNDEWDRFLVGMLATTILGTAAYITAHFWIHRGSTHGALSTAEPPAADQEMKNKKNNKDGGAAAAAASSGMTPGARAATSSSSAMSPSPGAGPYSTPGVADPPVPKAAIPVPNNTTVQ